MFHIINNILFKMMYTAWYKSLFYMHIHLLGHNIFVIEEGDFFSKNSLLWFWQRNNLTQLHSEKIHVFVEHIALGGNNVRKCYFRHKGQSEGHKVIDFADFGKGIINLVCMHNMKSLSLMVQKLANYKVDNRNTNKQTGRQTGQNTIFSIIRSGAKIICLK